MILIENNKLIIDGAVTYIAESKILNAYERPEGIAILVNFDKPETKVGNIRLIARDGTVIWKTKAPDQSRDITWGYDLYVFLKVVNGALVGVTFEGIEDQLDINSGRFIKLVGRYK